MIDDALAVQLLGFGEAAAGIEIARVVDDRPVGRVADDLRAAQHAILVPDFLARRSSCALAAARIDGSAPSAFASAYVRRGLCRHLQVSSVPSHASNVIG